MSFYEQQTTTYSQQGPPQVPHPWRAIWDPPANRYLYENEQTGQRTFEFPQQQHQDGQQGGYPVQQQGGYYGGAPQGRYGGNTEYVRQDTTEVVEERGGYQAQKPNHHYGGMVLAAGAGLVGGALMMHEGEKIRGFTGDL